MPYGYGTGVVKPNAEIVPTGVKINCEKVLLGVGVTCVTTFFDEVPLDAAQIPGTACDCAAGQDGPTLA